MDSKIELKASFECRYSGCSEPTDKSYSTMDLIRRENTISPPLFNLGFFRFIPSKKSRSLNPNSTFQSCQKYMYHPAFVSLHT